MNQFCLLLAFRYCINEGWQTDEVVIPTFQLPQLQMVKKGLIQELFLLYKKFNLQWNTCLHG